MSTTKFDQVIALIDEANQKDTNIDIDTDGKEHPKEWLYSQRMQSRLAVFAPDASEHLRIACHGQHIERWMSKRSDYPEGRTGYKTWRAELGVYHAKRVGELMAQVNYAQSDIDRTKFLVMKRMIKKDDESQTLEDVVCLVFLEYYLEPFVAKHETDKVIDIIQKTWKKMSENGHNAALSLPLSKEMQELIGKALGTE